MWTRPVLGTTFVTSATWPRCAGIIRAGTSPNPSPTCSRKSSRRNSSTSRPDMGENRIIIEAGRSERQYWRDLWRYRELLYFLAWRDILVRYKQTAIGIAWALIRPALTMLVFVAFRKLVA